jgi:hypothetical protein
MLQKYGEFNAISDELAAQLKSIAPGEKAIFRLLDGHKDPNTGEVFNGSGKSFRGVDKIWDPYKVVAGSKEKGAWVDIGIPDQVEPTTGKILRCKKFMLGNHENQLLGVNFQLYGNNDLHRQWYAFFQLCNINKSNPRRNQSADVKIEEVDFEAEGKVRASKRNSLREALNTVEGMDNIAVMTFATAMNWDTTGQKPGTVKDRISEYAERAPGEFLSVYNSPDMRVKSLVKQAIMRGIIRYDRPGRQMLWAESGQTLAILDRSESGNELDMMAAWVKGSIDGHNVISTLESMLVGKAKEEKPKAKTATAPVQ